MVVGELKKCFIFRNSITTYVVTVLAPEFKETFNMFFV